MMCGIKITSEVFWRCFFFFYRIKKNCQKHIAHPLQDSACSLERISNIFGIKGKFAFAKSKEIDGREGGRLCRSHLFIVMKSYRAFCPRPSSFEEAQGGAGPAQACLYSVICE